jgi:hypothetical protein
MFLKKSSWVLLLIINVLIGILFISSCAHHQQVRRWGETSPPPKLEAKLELYKKSYLVREPIWVNIQVTNTGKQEGEFYFMTYDRLIISDSKGKKYPSHAFIEYINPVALKSHEILRQQFDILNNYGAPRDSFHVRWYLPSEKYNVYYDLLKNVKSEICTFQVSEPEGDELKAMNLLKEAYDLQIQRNDKESLGKLKELIRLYPKSQYYIYALLLSAGSLDDWYDLIQRFPNSGEAIQAIGSIALTYENKKDKQGFIDAMNNLIQKYPDTDIAKEAEGCLKGFK